jgi:rhodanese-related sulfurtransferase
MENIPEFIGNHLFLVTLLIAVICLLIWNIFGDSMSGIRQVSPAELTRLINRENAVVVDIRAAGDFLNGHIIHALNIPEAEIKSRLKELEKHREKTVVVCCNTGTLSSRGVRLLKAEGFDNILALKGGLSAWQNAGLPLTREK